LQHVAVRCNVTGTRDFDNGNVTVVTAGVCFVKICSESFLCWTFQL
jgi:hypothetical protein